MGCTYAHLVAHLNGEVKVGQEDVDIDYVSPVSSFALVNSPIEQKACMNWNNFQLMKRTDNIKKVDYDPAAYAASAAGKARAILWRVWEVEFFYRRVFGCEGDRSDAKEE